MPQILVITTGGTFNKHYNPLTGTLDVDASCQTLQEIASKWLCPFECTHIIGKDSLEMTDGDRDTIATTIQNTPHSHILLIHGTDTMDLTAQHLFRQIQDKIIVLSGAMVPYTVDPVEATANFASAYGYLHLQNQPGVYIAMNGQLGEYQTIQKERHLGKFITL